VIETDIDVVRIVVENEAKETVHKKDKEK